MESFLTFLQMGGHAVFVWPSYALALIILLANGFAARRRRRRALEDIIERIKKEDPNNTAEHS